MSPTFGYRNPNSSPQARALNCYLFSPSPASFLNTHHLLLKCGGGTYLVLLNSLEAAARVLLQVQCQPGLLSEMPSKTIFASEHEEETEFCLLYGST